MGYKAAWLHLVACQIYGSLDLALHAKHEYLRFQPARIVGIQTQQTDVFMRKVPDALSQTF